MKRTIIALGAIALALALAGGAWAGKHYIITSSSQVKNGSLSAKDLSKKARKSLKGNRGPKGATGAQGLKGDTGPKGDQGPPGPPLQHLSGDFSGTNASVATSLDGVQFGPYTDGGAWGGSVRYDGANGMTLSQLTQLSYNVMYSAADTAPIGEAYLRIFLNGDSHDVIFDATQCASTVPAKNVFTTFEVVGSNVRYDDDSCDGAGNHNFPGSPAGQQTWASVLAHHGTETISGIYVTTGFTGGSDLTALLRSLSVNGKTFTFGS